MFAAKAVRDRRDDYLRAAPPPGAPPAPGMVWVPGGDFIMGSEDFYPEERPLRMVGVAGFWMDRNPVTNADFARFVRETKYLTSAEIPTDPALHPGLDPGMRQPGGLVFRRSRWPVSLDDPRQWWRFVAGAQWRRPRGKLSGIGGCRDHPVVQVSYLDACAYADWADKALPTEAEWEFAARGGLEGARYAWGNHERGAQGAWLANIWQGPFPWRNTAEDGFAETSPVGHYPANGFGLFDMAGNVWEWTASAAHGAPRHVLKGGSHLCSPQYCFRYRPAAKSAQEIDASTSHVGFRCIIRVPG